MSLRSVVHSHRLRLIPLAFVTAATLAACLPQLEIYPTLQGSGTYTSSTSSGETTYALTVQGEIRCNRTVSNEPIDVFFWGDLAGAEGSISGCFDTWRDWSITIRSINPPPTSANVELEICTNPAEPIDEDCQRISRLVKFTRV